MARFATLIYVLFIGPLLVIGASCFLGLHWTTAINVFLPNDPSH